MKADTLREIEARALAVPKNVTITTSTDPAEHNLATARFLSYARQDVPALVEEVYRLQAEISRLRREVAQYEESASMACEEPPPSCRCAGCSLARDRGGALVED
jgi:hypothetical protein